MSTIITRLIGGLGNQMFQYAAARCLADEHGIRELILDTAGFAHYPLRRYELGRLKVRAREAAKGELRSLGLAAAPWRRRAAAVLGRWMPLPQGKVLTVRERSFRHMDLPVPDERGLYLDGYWQSWKYLRGHEAALKRDLQPRAPASGPNLALLRRARARRAVALHVRRGDYVSNRVTAAAHGSLQAPYYQAALKRLKTGPRALVLIFSDEPQWVAANLRLHPGQQVVDLNGPSAPEEDLRLMAACRSLVIANSSLSWWAAWMAGPSAKVIAPKNWFAGKDSDTRDLCPPAWARL